MNAICVVVDRLHAGYLGCYGNSWIATPSFDHLAGESFLFDQATIDTPDLAALYRSYLLGQHALSPDVDVESLPRALRKLSVHSRLMTDDPLVAQLPLASDFSESIRVAFERTGEVAEEIDQTQTATLFAEAADWLAAAPEPFLLWIHSQGLGAVWDAPLEFRNRYADDPSVALYTSAEVPRRVLGDNYDPDEVLAMRWAYAGQVAHLDACLGALVDLLDETGLSKNTLLTVLSARGFPLGEHGRIGPTDSSAGENGVGVQAGERLHAETMHVPWLIRLPQREPGSDRGQALVQPGDLMPTLLEWWGIESSGGGRWGKSLLPLLRDEKDSIRDRACAVAVPGEWAIRTPAWHLRQTDSASNAVDQKPAAELYVKPDDRWEVNNVISRCPEIASSLEAAFQQCQQAIASGQTEDIAPLDEHLIVGN